MKKIGIITIEQVNNYGAELQAFATQRALQQMGHDAEIINYCYYKDWRFKDTKMSAPFIPMTGKQKILYWVKYRLINGVMSIVAPLLHPRLARRNKRFAEFHRENTKMSRRYMSMPELYAEHMNYDVYVAGSDQVWNPSASSSIEPYFLSFALSTSKRISYASSFGVSEISKNLQERYKSLLNNIDNISVREQTGVSLVKQLTGREATLVLDPTLLLDREQWRDVMKHMSGIPDKYILVYQLLPSATIPQLALQLGREMECPVLFLAKRAYGIKAPNGMQVVYDAGPAEFVDLIANAQCVVTNSFHGTAFSVNFGVPFFTVLNPNRKSNARMTSLLGQVGLEKRIVYENADISSLTAAEPISSTVQDELSKLRAGSLKWLQSAIG